MKHHRIHTISEVYFSESWNLYESAFPEEERRTMDAQERLFKNNNYHFDVFSQGDKFVGFLLWWDFGGFRFIEHFATSESVRNRGFGGLILEGFKKRSETRIILEVELPKSKIEQRRIQFYQRIGFHLNHHFYEIPVLKEGGTTLQLLIMSFPNAISEKEVKNFSKHYHPILFEG